MSDTGRKDFTQKAHEKMTPDSQKSSYDRAKETFSDAADRVTGYMQSDKDKSSTQSAFDSVRGKKDQEVHGSSTQSTAQKAKDAFGLGDE